MRSTLYQQFEAQLKEVLDSRGTKCLANVKEITDLQEGLNLINRSSKRKHIDSPYYLRRPNGVRKRP